MQGAGRRILLALLSAAALGVSAILIFLFFRSYWLCDSYATSVEPELVCFQSYRGRLHYVHVMPSRLSGSDRKFPAPGFSTVPADQAMLWQEWNGPPRDTYTSLGFAFANSLNAYTIAAVPYWPLIGLSAIPPLWLLPRLLRGIKRIRIKCTKCGYKIKKLVEACPRCGQILVPAGPPPPPVIEKPPPRPSKKVQSVVVKTLTPGQIHPRPTDGSDKHVL
jgi:hypothetical protein